MYTSAVLQQLYESEEMGPLGFLTVASVLNALHRHKAAKAFAFKADGWRETAA